jgi:hypothetical protein
MALGVATTSGLKTADGVVASLPAKIHSVVLAGGSDASSVIVYDNASAASGTVLVKLVAVAGDCQIYHSPNGLMCNNGIYVDVSGTGVGVTVHYELSG